MGSRLRLVVAHVSEPAYVPSAAAARFGGTAGRHTLMEEVESQEEVAKRMLEQVAATGGVDASKRNSSMRTWVKTGRSNFCPMRYLVLAAGGMPPDHRSARVA